VCGCVAVAASLIKHTQQHSDTVTDTPIFVTAKQCVAVIVTVSVTVSLCKHTQGHRRRHSPITATATQCVDL